MGNLMDDLEKFLQTDGIKIIVSASGDIRTEPYEPLTVEDIDDFDSMNLEELSAADLTDLQEKAEELRDDLEEGEPDDEESEAHSLWDSQLSATEDFIDRIRDRLDELEDEDGEGEEIITRRLVWSSKQKKQEEPEPMNCSSAELKE